MKHNVYVASSWRNNYHVHMVAALKDDGHLVYDYRGTHGFTWDEVDIKWQKWDPVSYIKALNSEAAVSGYLRDIQALKWCTALVYVGPSGVSAGMELGYAAGQGKMTIAYLPEIREPDLMMKMADILVTTQDSVRTILKGERF